jgi:hypothetical protein
MLRQYIVFFCFTVSCGPAPIALDAGANGGGTAGGSSSASGGGLNAFGGGNAGGRTDVDAGDTDASVDAGRDAGVLDSGLVDSGIDAGQSDAGSIDAGRVPAFVVMGTQLRRLISYDDGRTFARDVWWQNPDGGYYRCGDCDHNPRSPKGPLVVSNGYIFHTTGHGQPGAIYRSTNGVDFSPVLNNVLVGGLMAGNGVLLTAGNEIRRSLDNGITWSNPIAIDFRGATNEPIYTRFSGGFGGRDSGVFAIPADGAASDGGARYDVQVSRDLGLTWQRGRMTDGGHANQCSGKMVSGNGIIAFYIWYYGAGPGTETVCSSADNGATFTSVSFDTDYNASNMVFDGNQFLVWSYGKLHRSSDAVNWTTVNTSFLSADGGASGPRDISVVGVSPQKTFLAFSSEYETELVQRSTDGVNWKVAPHRNDGGHFVTSVIHTMVER